MRAAFLFPGQGAQSAGMGQDLYDNIDIYRRTFDECCEGAGLDLKKACFEGAGLEKGEIVQPAIFAHSISLFKTLKSEGVDAQIYAGLSLGEYTALCAAGVFGVAQCALVLRRRGSIMDGAFPEGEGGMLSVIGFPIDEVEESIKYVKGAYAANHLSELQIVVSGRTADLLRLKELFEQKGAKMAAMLSVAGPFHSPLMGEAANEFYKLLDGTSLGGMQMPVYSNVRGAPYGKGDDVKRLLAEQMRSRVKWHECTEHMIAGEMQRFTEVGPSNVLSKLVKRRAGKDAAVESVRDVPTLQKFLSVNKQ